MPRPKLMTTDYQLRTFANNSVNSLFLYCYFGLHLTSAFVFGMEFRRLPLISHYKQNPKVNVTLINVFLQAKI